MIPSTWGRLCILVLFLVAIAEALLLVAARLAPANIAFAQTIAALVFLLGFYTISPITARFLVPVESRDRQMQCRLDLIQESMPDTRPVILYDHAEKNAYTVGILECFSCVYLTTGLMAQMSNDGLRGILAHEETHVREHHLFITFSYACGYAMLSHMTGNSTLFVSGFLGLMFLRRLMEYRADAGAAKLAGVDAMLAGLRDLELMYPPKQWGRWIVPFVAYPTLPMRIRALESDKRHYL